jgi:hypothetical protein
LRERVNAAIEESGDVDNSKGLPNKGRVELGEFEPVDTSHLFWDELRLIGDALRVIRKEDLTDDLLQELLVASEKVWKVIGKIRKRSQKRAAQRRG